MGLAALLSLPIFVFPLTHLHTRVISHTFLYTVKPLGSGHLRDQKKVSVSERCPLYGDLFKGNPYLGPEEVSTCPLYWVSASQRFH